MSQQDLDLLEHHYRKGTPVKEMLLACNLSKQAYYQTWQKRLKCGENLAVAEGGHGQQFTTEDSELLADLKDQDQHMGRRILASKFTAVTGREISCQHAEHLAKKHLTQVRLDGRTMSERVRYANKLLQIGYHNVMPSDEVWVCSGKTAGKR